MKQSELDQLVCQYFELKKQIDLMTDECEAIKDKLKIEMVNQGSEHLNGTGWRATWHNTVTTRFDSSSFKKQYSELYNKFCKPTCGTRFTLNQIGGGV